MVDTTMTLAHQYQTTIISSGTSVWMIATILHLSEIFHPEAATYFIITAATTYLTTTRADWDLLAHARGPRVKSGNWIL